MATKRMFSKDIVGSDAFIDMPSTSQLLYFHLGMEADDDGFIGNPKKVSRFIGASDDDLKILLSKKFILIFDTGVIVIKHHRINNNWDRYNCKRTVYLEEFGQLNIKENKAYTLDTKQGIPAQTGNSLKPVFRIEENKGDKNKGEESKPVQVDFNIFWELYPKKVEKKKSEIKWKKLPLQTQQFIVADLKKRVLGEKWSKDGGRYIEMPTTYLNGERWNDEIEERKVEIKKQQTVDKFGK